MAISFFSVQRFHAIISHAILNVCVINPSLHVVDNLFQEREGLSLTLLIQSYTREGDIDIQRIDDTDNYSCSTNNKHLYLPVFCCIKDHKSIYTHFIVLGVHANARSSMVFINYLQDSSLIRQLMGLSIRDT